MGGWWWCQLLPLQGAGPIGSPLGRVGLGPLGQDRPLGQGGNVIGAGTKAGPLLGVAGELLRHAGRVARTRS